MQYLRMGSSDPTKPDAPPKGVNVGAINPFALVEAILGRSIDTESISSVRILSDVLQSDYDELFDMKNDSVLYAGLKLNSGENKAERISSHDMHTLTAEDMATPDMSRIHKVNDLEHVGLKDVGETKVKLAMMQNGKLHLVLHPHAMGRTLSNSTVTESLFETVTPFRKEKGDWTPPNGTWENMGDFVSRYHRMQLMPGFQGGRHIFDSRGNPVRLDMRTMEYNDPVQGAIGNSWLIAALFAVAWSDPYKINRDNLAVNTDDKQKKRTFKVKLYSKGGDNDAPTSMVEVGYEIPMNNSSNMPIYCRSSNYIGAMWPSLYEKAFAKWMSRSSSDHPDITQTAASAAGGDPIKAMAQINDGKPEYFFTRGRSDVDLIGLVRANCANFKTINPMAAWTYASGEMYKGSYMVANHAYTVLGWASPHGQKQYIILRNPWGVKEPAGLTTYQGLLDNVDYEFWHPADTLDRRGVFALEASAFKVYFACIGISK